jgi:large subunit ribosomal protein L32e
MSDLEKMTVAELKVYAEEHGVDLTGVTKKADLVASINKSEGNEPTPAKAAAPEVEAVESKPKVKAQLDDDTQEALELRDAEQRRTPAFRRQEWFRYKKLGGKTAGWRRPRGTHSKMRRHYKYRPPVVSIGYRTNAVARGLHPSGFEEVLVHRPVDLESLDAKTQGARIGGTVGGKKQAAIVAKADEMGVRVFNRGGN